jgi:hypothetical protein
MLGTFPGSTSLWSIFGLVRFRETHPLVHFRLGTFPGKLGTFPGNTSLWSISGLVRFRESLARFRETHLSGPFPAWYVSGKAWHVSGKHISLVHFRLGTFLGKLGTFPGNTSLWSISGLVRFRESMVSGPFPRNGPIKTAVCSPITETKKMARKRKSITVDCGDGVSVEKPILSERNKEQRAERARGYARRRTESSSRPWYELQRRRRSWRNGRGRQKRPTPRRSQRF